MRFVLDGHTLDFEAPSQYPLTRPTEKIQTMDRAADGSLQVEQNNLSIVKRTLNFSEMSLNDYSGLLDWFENVSDGAANAFTFEDERDGSDLVRITSSVYNFRETSFELYSGSLELEYV